MSSPTTFKFDEKLTATLEDLKKSTGASSKAEVVRRAIALLKVAQEGKDHGRKLVLRSGDEAKLDQEIVMP
jgi:hypothetical protein